MSLVKKGTVVKIEACRMCGNKHLETVVDLGEQYLTGVFPKERTVNDLTKGPLILVKCHGPEDRACGLLQLEHTYCLEELYGENYGYRSGLNKQMVAHLNQKIERLKSIANLQANDLVIDIGSNDGTSLGFYPENLDLIGIDPTAEKFKQYYKPHINIIPDFFTASKLQAHRGDKLAKVVTSFSMLYDLEQPLKFAREISSVLDPEAGIWCFEQSYMPLMLERLAFDTICHEHLEYYAFAQIEWMLGNVGLRVIDVELNDVNGGSFSVIASNKSSKHEENTTSIRKIREHELNLKLNELTPYLEFAKKVDTLCSELKEFVLNARKEHKKVGALGASTKGNVLLQKCQFNTDEILAVGEVNQEKFGTVTPGTWLPIVPESQILQDKFNYLIVLPWHFRDFFLSNEAFKGQTLIFPMPEFEIVQL